LGGNLSWALQYLVGLMRLGHEVYFVEKSGYADSCYDPSTDAMTNDCTYGVRVVSEYLRRIGLGERWCYVDAEGVYYGLQRHQIEALFGSADVFLDNGTHGTWLDEASHCGLTVLIDAEPGMRQLRMQKVLDAGGQLPHYDFHFTKGWSIANGTSTAPSAGPVWRGMFHPVVTDLFEVTAPPDDAPFTTVMNWQSYERIDYGGKSYGHKDLEFEKFITLPRHTRVPMEIAVAGKNTPSGRLREHGWRLNDAHYITRSTESFGDYIRTSRGEFCVCKNGFVALKTGWFSDRAAAYLASARPVVMQETGFSRHLPTGRGLFAVTDVAEAAEAVETVCADYANHSKWARELACEYLEATKVLGDLLDAIGIGRQSVQPGR
jgi:hypothetical protein